MDAVGIEGISGVASGAGAGAPSRVRTWIFVATIALVAACLYAMMRVDGGHALRFSYAYLCSRLAMHPGDWPCRVTDANTVLVYVVGSLSVGVGLAIPCMVLASTGRRVTALVPLALPVAIAALWSMTSALWYMEARAYGRPYLGMWPTLGTGAPTTFWFRHTALATAVDMLLLAAPAVAVVVFARPARERPAARGSWLSTINALAICAAGSAVLLWGSVAVARHLWPAEFAFTSGEPGGWIVPAVAMATFGALLGRDRRWWPWIFAPVAVLLTGATMTVLMSSVEHVWNLSGFGAAIPYFGIGLICSFVQPLALRLSRGRAPVGIEPIAAFEEQADPAEPGQEVRGVRRVRPRVLAAGAAAALLVVSASAFLLDPSPARYAEVVPTYLGARTYVQDLRTRTDLWRGMVAVDRYRNRHGSLAGFDAATARAAAPAVAWTDGIPASSPQIGLAFLRFGRWPTLVSFSESGTAYCARDGLAGITYGTYEARSGQHLGPARVFIEAMATCDSAPLTPAAMRPFPVGQLCDGAADDALVICRGVQNMLRRMMETPEPSSMAPSMT